MTDSNQRPLDRDVTPDALDPAAGLSADATADAPADEHAPPHPPFARSSDEYTDPPGHHRREPDGPALDVGA